MTRDDLIKRVKDFLKGPDLKSFELQVFESGVRQDDDWWYIPIAPQADGVRAFDYAGKLHSFEESLENKEGVKVLIIPSVNE